MPATRLAGRPRRLGGSSAVSFSPRFLVTASRMRACAWDTASRLCVRTMLCSSAFLSIPTLPSTDPAAGRPALFAGFIGSISGSDFCAPCFIGFGPRPFRCGPPTTTGAGADLPVPVQEASVHARVSDDVGSSWHSHYRTRPCCLLPLREHRHPRGNFRRSMAGLYAPLSTLRPWPRGHERMTRGRCRSLALHRSGLAPLTSCRSPGAPKNPVRLASRSFS
jgi:hypothetical protein